MDRDETGGMTDHEWQNRILCSDESCIGVIGPDGRCKECGKPYEGELPSTFKDAPSADTAEAPDEMPSGRAADDEARDDDDTDVSDDEWARRRLCVDESCIGVIGPDGRCKECGKPG